MRILISNHAFAGFGGTESYMLTVAEQLQRLGHETAIHAPELGAMAEFTRSRGIQVLSAAQLPDECDLILAQDAGTCYELSARYRRAKLIYIAHSYIHMLQTPPQLPDVYDALVVLNERTHEWARGLAHTEPIVRLRQPVDLMRFRTTPPHQTGKPRVFVLSWYHFGSRIEQLKRAGEQAGVELYWLTEQTPHPEREIARSDAVIGLGRSALDAMASSRPVVVFGPLGGDGWVTPENYPQLEADGFVGRATDSVLDEHALAAELAAWNPAMGNANRDLISRHHDVRDHAGELMALASEVVDRSPVRPRGYETELARLVRVEWERSSDLITARWVNNQLTTERERQTQEFAELSQQLHETRQALEYANVFAAEAARRYEGLVATRRWKLATALGRPLDWLRTLVRG
jgi:HAMP domain-containing protein